MGYLEVTRGKKIYKLISSLGLERREVEPRSVLSKPCQETYDTCWEYILVVHISLKICIFMFFHFPVQVYHSTGMLLHLLL